MVAVLTVVVANVRALVMLFARDWRKELESAKRQIRIANMGFALSALAAAIFALTSLPFSRPGSIFVLVALYVPAAAFLPWLAVRAGRKQLAKLELRR